MGIIAQERQRFDEAEQWYRKALAIFERLGHPPLLVDTLAQLGVLYRLRNRFDQAVLWFGKALIIAVEYKMRVGMRIWINLDLVMKAMGEEKFTAAWRQAFKDQEPPLTIPHQIIANMIANMEEGTPGQDPGEGQN